MSFDNLCKLLSEKHPVNWEENPEQFLNDPALLPLAPLAATTQPQSLLQTLNLEQLENLGEALLDFQAQADLETWFSGLE